MPPGFNLDYFHCKDLVRTQYERRQHHDQTRENVDLCSL